MKVDRIILLPAGVLAAGAILMFLFLGMRTDPPKRTPQPRTRMVDAIVVDPGRVLAEIEAFGTVRSAQPVELYAEVAGTAISGDVPFQNAQTFDSGDVLLRIDDRQVQLDRQSAISDLLSALANVMPEIKISYPADYADWQRYFDAVHFDAPVPQLPEARNQQIKLFLSRYNVYKLYFNIRNLEIRLEKHTIRAPFTGTIVVANIKAGSSARAGASLGSVINLRDMEVDIPIPASEVDWIDRAGPVYFTSAEFGGERTGRIKRIGQSIDERTQTVTIYTSLNSSATPVPDGTFLTAHFTGKRIEDAIELPRRSIYQDRFVYLVKDGKLVYHEITVARRQKETVVVKNGLATGDTLVIEPLQGVAPGMLAAPNFRNGAQPAP